MPKVEVDADVLMFAAGELSDLARWSMDEGFFDDAARAYEAANKLYEACGVTEQTATPPSQLVEDDHA